MKRLPILALLFFIASGVHATTRTAASCSTTDVQTTINASANGDTVLVPSNLCPSGVTWAPGALTISASHQIIFNGQSTIVNYSSSGGDPGFGNAVIIVTTGSANNTIITGFTFNGGFINGRAPIIINTSSSSLPFRVYGNTLTYNGAFSAGTMLTIIGDGPGLIDHNNFSTNINFTEMIHNFGSNSQTADWSSDVIVGGSQNVFLEDNTFTGPAGSFAGAQAIENYQGARFVFRHNTLNNAGFDAHGDTSGLVTPCAQVNTRWYEIYTNTINLSQGTDIPTINLRGGSGVIWNNVHNGGAGKVQLQADCLSASSGVPYPFQDQDGRGITTSSGSSTTNASPIYIWNNTNFSVGTLSHDSSPTTYIQSGRDYFTSASQPATITRCESAADVSAGCPVSYAYVPYTYPHPLTNPVTTPQINFAPAGTFGTSPVGTAAAPITFTISNTGTGTETYTAITTSTSIFVLTAAASNPCALPSGTIAASGSCNVTVTATPTSQTTFNGTLNIAGTANASTNLSVTGQTSISIPATPTNLTATLTGGSTVTLNWTASTGTPTGYNCASSLVSGGPYTPFGPGASPVTLTTCSISGLVTPGNHYFVVNAFNSAGTSANTPEVVVNIVGTAPAVNLNPPSLSFGTIVQGNTSIGLTVTLTNNGTATLSSISIANPSGPNGADFAQTNTCGATLAVNATCAITATFTPSTTTNENASIVVTTNASSSPDTISLFGAGQPSVVLNPASITVSNTYTSHTSATAVLTYTNTSASSITISSIAFSGGDAAMFSETDNCVGSVSASASCTINITFTPTSNGTKSTTLVITDSTSASPRNVSVTGKATGHVVRIGVAI